MKRITRRIIRTLFPTVCHYTATIAHSGLIFCVSVEAPDERHARMEVDEMAEGGFVIGFARA